jgi:hypothetical protein
MGRGNLGDLVIDKGNILNFICDGVTGLIWLNESYSDGFLKDGNKILIP